MTDSAAAYDHEDRMAAQARTPRAVTPEQVRDLIDIAANIYHSLPENKRFQHLHSHQLVMIRLSPETRDTVFAPGAGSALTGIYLALDPVSKEAFKGDYQRLMEYLTPTTNA